MNRRESEDDADENSLQGELDNLWFQPSGSQESFCLRPMQPNKYQAEKKTEKLGQWCSTAIAGNDVTASCLYVAGISSLEAGQYTPIVMMLVGAILYLFRSVYSEVGTALPLNGGTYNVLLNTTTKGKAAAGACLTMLSYVATAVVSACSAAVYASKLSDRLDVMVGTVVLLGLFALLNLIGIVESSRVALLIFGFHILTLGVLSVMAILHADQDLFMHNWRQNLPKDRTVSGAIFYGYCAALLGVSGFETSANYIEEQKPGVFPKTLRNVWAASAVFNPLLSFLALCLLPLDHIALHSDHLLSEMGLRAGGRWLEIWVGADAALVLSGSVLTSYVGFTGLVRRMSLDRCLPQVLVSVNRLRGTNHWIILGFFALCTSLYMSSQGSIDVIAGVYTISFLSVMSLFSIGNCLLKVRRGRLPRRVKASWFAVLIGLFAVLAGLYGNILEDPTSVQVFVLFFTAIAAPCGVMFYRIAIMGAALNLMRPWAERSEFVKDNVFYPTKQKVLKVFSNPLVYFTHNDSPQTLVRVVLYVLKNEQRRWLKFVHVYNSKEEVPPHLEDTAKSLAFLFKEMRIDLLLVEGSFDPPTINQISHFLGVPKNFMFISCPGKNFQYPIADLGLRVIVS